MDKVKFFNNPIPLVVRVSSTGAVLDIRQGISEILDEEDELKRKKRKKRVNKVFVSRGGIRL